VLRSSLLITALTLVGSFFGLLVQILMAQRYGSGVEVDSYLYSISTPTFVAGLLASLLSYTVVPRMAQYSARSDQQIRLIVSLIALALCVALFLLLISPLLSYVQKELLPERSSIQQQHNLQKLLMIGWCIAATQILLAAACALLTGLKKAITSTALNLGPYVAMLVGMLITQGGTEQLAFAMLAGTCASLTLAFVMLERRVRGHWHQVSWQEVRALVMRSPYTIVAMSCFSAYAVVDSYWAPRAGEGVLASLGYAQRIMIAVGNLAVAGPSAMLVPKFSEIVAYGSKADFDRMFNKTLAVTFAIGFTLAVCLYLGAEPLIQWLFTRGAFDQQDAARATAVLQYCLPGMVFMLLSVISLRVLFCFYRVEKLAALLGVSWCFMYFFLSSHLIGFHGKGMAAAYSLTWIVYFAGAFISIKIKSKVLLK
jgi:putative peptidoglycan lipid II flippase